MLLSWGDSLSSISQKHLTPNLLECPQWHKWKIPSYARGAEQSWPLTLHTAAGNDSTKPSHVVLSEKENKCSFPLKLQSTLNSMTQAIPFSWITTDSAPSVRCSSTASAFRRWGQEITRLTPHGWVTKYFLGRPMLIRHCILNQNLTKSKTIRKQNKAPYVKWASKAIMVWENGQLRLPGGHCWVWIKETHSTGTCMGLTLPSRVSSPLKHSIADYSMSHTSLLNCQPRKL